MIMAKIVRTDEELDSLWNLVSKLGMELGRSREWDVFVTEILPSISNVNNANAKSVQQILAREGEKHRLLNYQLVFAALQNSDFQRLLLRCVFHGHSATQSTHIRPPIPLAFGH
jgi:capsular polysaccharide biosynthesis protein